MISGLLWVLSTAQADDNIRDVGLDLGMSLGCFGVCLNYDRQITERVDVGITTTVLIILDTASLYGQLELGELGSSLIYLEPSAGILLSPLSREASMGASLSLGWERSFDQDRFLHIQIGGGAFHDLDEWIPWPDVRLGLGRRY